MFLSLERNLSLLKEKREREGERETETERDRDRERDRERQEMTDVQPIWLELSARSQIVWNPQSCGRSEVLAELSG